MRWCCIHDTNSGDGLVPSALHVSSGAVAFRLTPNYGRAAPMANIVVPAEQVCRACGHPERELYLEHV